MRVKFELKDGQTKKGLVADIAEITGEKAEYQKPPTFAYFIGDFVVDRDGDLITDNADDNKAEQLIEALLEKGYEGDAMQEFPGLCISYPRKKISDEGIERLKLVIASKENLIKKALGIEELPLEIEEDRILFPWFPGKPEPEEVKAYTGFISALCQHAEKQSRVTAQEKDVENEKYAFRCFLLRLGFVGKDDELKAARKILLRNLSGSAAFKSGKKKDAGDEPAEKALAQDEALAAATEAETGGGEENE